jgi:hypothetical protein
MLDYDRGGARCDVTRGGDARQVRPPTRLNHGCRVRPDPVYQLVALRKET